MPEALVIFACINNTGCQETSSQYYATNAEARKYLTKQERRVRELMGPYFMEIIGPSLYITVGGTGTIKISKHFSLQANRQNAMIIFVKDF